jgi:hypothetical protein
MAGIKQPILDILTKLSTIQVTNLDGYNVPLYTRIWNNQLNDLKEGKIESIPRPAAFVEIVSPVSFDTIGIGLRSADLGIKIHLVHDFINNEVTFGQDLEVFDLRDKILFHTSNPNNNAGLNFFIPTGCSPMICIQETQEYDHDNLYHYVLEFVCNFIDSKGSAYDAGAGQFVDTANPNLDAIVVKDGVPNAVVDNSNNQYIIP